MILHGLSDFYGNIAESAVMTPALEALIWWDVPGNDYTTQLAER